MNQLLICICLGITIGISIMELYTILKAKFKSSDWSIKIYYNYFHEGYLELFMFIGILILNLYTIFWS